MKDWDIVVALAGEEGSGKSTLAIQLARLIDPGFKLESHVIFDPNNKVVVDKVKTLPKYSCIILDEAIKTMYKLNWASTEQKMLNMAFALCRKYNQIVILCIPRFRDLNEQFRNWRAKLWIQVVERGRAAIFTPDMANIWHLDPWHMEENSRFLLKSTKRMRYSDIDTDKKIDLWNKVGSFLDECPFEKLPEDIEGQYKSLKGEVDIAAIEEGVKSEQLNELKRAYWEFRKDGYTLQELIPKFNRQQSALYKWDREGIEEGVIPV